ncbi:Mitochondrial substrate/solute carrier [Penicillium malachiteum]|uniref:Mitochondrial substrate/solute carrier n=1 Tax=Penicillium malachiteum TaxID=1324776 RepID=UPI002546BE2F|nr:Mitochondrial substrate/solute carrier [Penicillium malachiteum]KAJ5714119.1 Mitochondrial substrate/solute carrier [Penicillium malachiteum]
MYNSHTDIWIAGAFAAVVVDFIVYPFDTLKTRVQSPNYERVFKDPRTGAVKRNILFRGLYQGVWSVVFSTIPSSGAFFTTYEAVKYASYNSSRNPQGASPTIQTSRSTLRLPFDHSLPAPVIHAIASSSAEMVSCLMLTPAEVLKQNAQMVNTSTSPASSNTTSKHQNTNAMREVLSKFKSQPWRLWSGYTALVGRNLPFTGLQFPMFEFVRSRVIDWRRRRKTQKHILSGETRKTPSSVQRDELVERTLLTGLSAAVSGTVSSFVTTPIDVVKTRVMLSATDIPHQPEHGSKSDYRTAEERPTGKKMERPPTKGTWDIGKEIFRNEGLRGLFKGGAIRSGWTAISLSLYLSLYEGGRMFLENRRKEMEGISPGT